jgi:hypothetical protein
LLRLFISFLPATDTVHHHAAGDLFGSNKVFSRTAL